MNVTRMRQQERMAKIGQMENSLRKATEPDLNRLIMMCCREWGISVRTAKEYLKQAQFNIENAE